MSIRMYFSKHTRKNIEQTDRKIKYGVKGNDNIMN